MKKPDKQDADLHDLLKNNRLWAEKNTRRDPDYFRQMSETHHPKYLWIGCSDSRIPANEIVGLPPGDMFVHRNVSNIVSHDDTNCLAVIHYALDVLNVEHIIVTGHYGCGGIDAVLKGAPDETLDNWLWPVQQLYNRHKKEIDALPDKNSQADRLCELNVAEQVKNVASLHVVRKKWREGKPLHLHGLIYHIGDGLLHNLDLKDHTRVVCAESDEKNIDGTFS